MKKIIILSLIIHSSLVVSNEITSKDNCFITINSITKKMEKKTEIKKYYFESEKKCKKTAEIYKENFNPDHIKKVEVNYKWSQK